MCSPAITVHTSFRFTRPHRRTICHSFERSDSRAPRGAQSVLIRAFRFTRPKRGTICTHSSVQIHAPQEGHDLYSFERSDSRAPRGARSVLSRAFRFTRPKRGTICTVVPADYAAASSRGQHSPTGFRFTWSKNRPRSAVRSRSVYPFSGHLRVREFGAADTNAP